MSGRRTAISPAPASPNRDVQPALTREQIEAIRESQPPCRSGRERIHASFSFRFAAFADTALAVEATIKTGALGPRLNAVKSYGGAR